MNQKSLLISVLTFIVAISTLVVVLQKNDFNVGSVSGEDSGYYATTTSSTDGSATLSYMACKGPSGAANCMLGSLVVVQPATAGYVRLWDATSTATTSYTSTRSGTFGLPVARVDNASDAFGTLTFDQSLQTGLVIETSADFNGEYVVTWKY